MPLPYQIIKKTALFAGHEAIRRFYDPGKQPESRNTGGRVRVFSFGIGHAPAKLYIDCTGILTQGEGVNLVIVSNLLKTKIQEYTGVVLYSVSLTAINGLCSCIWQK